MVPFPAILKTHITSYAGAPPGGGARGPPPPPLGAEKHYIFRVSSVKLRDLHLRSLFFEDFCYVGGLRKPAAW